MEKNADYKRGWNDGVLAVLAWIRNLPDKDDVTARKLYDSALERLDVKEALAECRSSEPATYPAIYYDGYCYGCGYLFHYCTCKLDG